MELTEQKNEKLLKNQLPWLYEQIKDLEMDERDIRVKKAKKTDHAILEKYDGDSWFSLYSRFNPIEESEKWANSIEGDPNDIVMFGFGLGYHFEFLVKRFPHARFHIIEPDAQLFINYINEKDLSRNFKSNVENFLISNSTGDFKTFFQAIIHFIDDKNWLFLSLPKFETAYSETFKKYNDAFLECKKNYEDQLVSMISFEKVWNFNVLRNYSQIYKIPNIFAYKNQFEGKTVILTASGPSLNEAIPFIKRAQKHYNIPIIAAGTSVNGLLNKGIIPELFVSYDPFIGNYNALKKVLNEAIPFVFASTIYPNIPAEYKGPKAYMLTAQDKISHFVNPKIDQSEIIRDSPTITGVTLDLLNKLGVSKVYLAGQDLCFINNKTGAEGVYIENIEGMASDHQLNQKIYVENNNGEKSLTNSSFLKMKISIESIINQMERKMPIYSLSLYGSKIKGMQYRNIENAETDLEKVTTRGIVFNMSEFTTQIKIQDVLNKVSKEIDYFSQIKDALERQFVRFQSATVHQKEKWREKVDKSLDRITHHQGYQEIILPLVSNRISYMIRLKSNADFSDLKQVDEYFDKGVRPLIRELSLTLREYKSILTELKECQDNINSVSNLEGEES